MKMRSFLVTALCLIFAGVAPAQQQWSSPKLISDVPFDFILNGTTFPAGTYVVTTYTNGQILKLQNRDKPEFATMVFNHDILLAPSSIHHRASLVFSLNNGQQVLHQIRLAGDNHTHDIVHGNEVAELILNR